MRFFRITKVLQCPEQSGGRALKPELRPVNEKGVAKAKELGLDAVIRLNLVAYVKEQTEGRYADVVFEVAGVQQVLDVMTEVAGIRGRIVMVAIHGEPKPVILFKFFWKELKLIGARVYEKEDYEKSIELITANDLPFEEMITDVQPLSNIQKVFENIDNNPDGMKVLMDCTF